MSDPPGSDKLRDGVWSDPEDLLEPFAGEFKFRCRFRTDFSVVERKFRGYISPCAQFLAIGPGPPPPRLNPAPAHPESAPESASAATPIAGLPAASAPAQPPAGEAPDRASALADKSRLLEAHQAQLQVWGGLDPGLTPPSLLRWAPPQCLIPRVKGTQASSRCLAAAKVWCVHTVGGG